MKKLSKFEKEVIYLEFVSDINDRMKQHNNLGTFERVIKLKEYIDLMNDTLYLKYKIRFKVDVTTEATYHVSDVILENNEVVSLDIDSWYDQQEK